MAGVTVRSAICWMLGLSYEEYKTAGFGVPSYALSDDMYITFWINPPMFKVKQSINLIRSYDFISEKKGMFYGTIKAKELLFNKKNKLLYEFLDSCEISHPMSEIAKEEGLPQMSVGIPGFDNPHSCVFALHEGEEVPSIINCSYSFWKSETNPILKKGETFRTFFTFHERKTIEDHDVYICTIKTSNIPDFIKTGNKKKEG